MRIIRKLLFALLLCYAVIATISAVMAFPPVLILLIAVGIWAVRKGADDPEETESVSSKAPLTKVPTKADQIEKPKRTRNGGEEVAPSKELAFQYAALILEDAIERHHSEYKKSNYPNALENVLTLKDYQTYGIPGDLVEITLKNGKRHGACRSFRFGLFGWSALSHEGSIGGRWEPFRGMKWYERSFEDDAACFEFYSDKDARCFELFHEIRGITIGKMTAAAIDECARACATTCQELDTAVNNFISILPSSLFTDPDLHDILLVGLCLNDDLMRSWRSLGPYSAEELEHPAYTQAVDLFAALTGITKSKLEIDHRLASMTTYLLVRKKLVESYSEKWSGIIGAVDGDPVLPNLDSYISNAVNRGHVRSDDCESLACLTYYLIGLQSKSLPDYQKEFYKVKEAVASAERERYNHQLTASLLSEVSVCQENRHVDIEDIDEMSGDEFEQAVCRLFCKMGYSAYVTKQSGDQGVDVVAERGSVRIGIQAKRYGYPVGNSAVQETIAGRAFYGCTSSMVITNSTFTKSAIELARVNSVVLWDRAALQKKLMEYPITD